MDNIIRVSYSLLSLFKNCRKAADFKYAQGLKSAQQRSYALNFGTIFHACLEKLYNKIPAEEIYKYIDSQFPGYEIVEEEKLTRLHLRAMLEGYINKYTKEDNNFEVISTEKEFFGPITDMDSSLKEPLKGVEFTGKIDGIVKMKDTGEIFLLEHKTAKSISGSYIDRLWSDFQIVVYVYYVNKVFKMPCSGVFYNVIQKPDIKRLGQETEEEYQERRKLSASKNKSGTTNIKKKLGESDEEFEDRLAELYLDSKMYHRELIYVTKNQMKSCVEEISEMTKAFLSCIKREKFYKNTDYCYRYGSPCEYFPICKSGNNQNVIDNNYEKKPRYELNLIEDTGVF